MSETAIPTVAPVSDPAAVAAESAVITSPDAGRKPKDKVRSAWIGFAGRIVAQLIGAVATVLLGVYVANSYARHVMKPEVPTTTTAPAAPTTGTPTPVVARTRQGQGLALVVLPFQDYTAGAGNTHVAHGLTEALTAALARAGQVQVISRTSAMQFEHAQAPLPTIAATLGVDLVVEGSISRQDDRVRVTVQLIDARSDEHLWAQSYDRTTRDVLALEAEVSAAIARELGAVLPRATQGSAGPATTASDAPARSSQWLVASDR